MNAELPSGSPPVKPSFGQVLRRGLRRRCPACGEGMLFDGFYELKPRCPECRLVYEPSAGDTWWMTYIGSASVAGLMMLVVFLIRPPEGVLDKAVYLTAGLAILIGTLPHRKGLAVAIDFFTRDWSPLAAAEAKPSGPAAPASPSPEEKRP